MYYINNTVSRTDNKETNANDTKQTSTKQQNERHVVCLHGGLNKYKIVI